MNPNEVDQAIALFINAEEREAACLDLAANGGAFAIDALHTRLNEAASPAEFQRQAYAAYTLGLMGSAAVEVVPDMIALLQGTQVHDGTRQHIIRALSRIAPGTNHADAALTVLGTQTTHANHTVRRKAAEAIEQFFEEIGVI